MHRFWELIIKPILSEIKLKHVVEIGTAEGKLTRELLEFATAHDAIVHSVDPLLMIDLDQWKAEYGDRFHFYQMLSLNAIPKIDAMDVVLIDGDHNWYTVHHELKLIEKKTEQTGLPFPIVMLHDVGWPYGRRDVYYDPETIPEAYRQPYQYRGISPDSPELVDKGGINPHLANAIYENNLKSGVQTAIEDFQKESKLELAYYQIHGFHGIGILVQPKRHDKSKLIKILEGLQDKYSKDILIDALEMDRIHSIISTHDQLLKETELNEKRELEIRNLEIQYSAKIDDLEEIHASLEGKKKDLERTINEFKTTMKGIEKENDTLRTKLATFEESNDSLNAKLKDLKTLEQERNANLNMVEAELGRLQQEHKEVQRRLEKTVTLNQSLSNELMGYRDRLHHSEKRIDELIEERKRQINLLISWIEDFQAGIDGLLKMRRWIVGNKIGNVYQSFIRKPSGYTALDLLDETSKKFEEWQYLRREEVQKKA